MADREQNLHKIIKFLKEFKTEVELRNSINLYDINIHAEYFYRDLFNLVYGLGLKNLNAQTTNAAYIDLIDAENKIAIQVTSQNDNAKIKGAIEGFFANSANKDFRLILLLIAKKAKDYKTDFTESGKYKFNHEQDVVDIERLLAKIADKNDDEIKVIADFLATDKIKFSSALKFHPTDFPAQNNYFTGRETVLKNIATALQTHNTAAIADTHGVGKSSVVNEFAYLNKSDYKQILFIRAAKGEFDISVSKLSASLKIDLPNDAKPEQRLSAFQSWLAENDNWLLLVDNVDNVGEVFACKFNKPNGKVIYTANDEQIYKVGTKVELPKMSDDNAVLLLYKHWRNNADATFADIPENYRQTLKEIAGKFGNHPFSMAFVGSYLADEQESLDEFLADYQSKQANLLATYSFLNAYRHKEVATAFLLRFEQISTPKDESEREQFLSVAVTDYLKLSAYIGTDNIPEELLQQCLAKLYPNQSAFTDDKTFIKEIYKRFKPTSIFKRDPETKTLTTHRIVQEIMRFQIGDEEDFILETLAESLDNNFQLFDFTNKEIVERHLQQVEAFLEYLEANNVKELSNLKLENESTADLCNSYARYYEEYGQYEKAKKYYVYFNDICGSHNKIDQKMLARSYINLGWLYNLQNKYNEAEPLFEKALAIRKKVFGGNHLETAESYNKSAINYELQGRYKKAEPLFKKALAIRKKVLGENHPDTAEVIDNLAGFYSKIDKLKLAKKYQQISLAVFLKNYGQYHPDVAISYWWLATFCQKESKYQEALTNYYKAKEIYLRLFQIEHPDIQTLQGYIDKCERLLSESKN